MNGLYVVLALVVVVAIVEPDFVEALVAFVCLVAAAYAFYLWTLPA